MSELTEIPNQSETKKASKKPRSKPGRKRTATKGRKTPAGRGGARLRDSVNDEIGKQSLRIAKALIDNTCAGDMDMAHLVLGLAGADIVPPEKKKRHGPQPWVRNICSEPQWEGPWEDEDGKRDASKLPLSDYDLADEDK